MKTICEHCIFRENDDYGMQVDCYVDRINKFRKAGRKIELEGNFFSIDSYCNMCFWRPRGDARTLKQLMDEAVEVTRLRCDYITWPKNPGQLSSFINQVNTLITKPESVIILNSLKINLTSFAQKLKTPWTIITEVNSPLTWDDGIDKVKSEYFAFDNEEVDEHLVEYGQDILNNKMIPFWAITGKWGNLVNKEIYKYFCGKIENFPDKLINLPEKIQKNLTEKMVYTWSELPL